MAGEGPPLSLRPYPVADKEPKSIADFIARVNAQPGGFRSVNEAKLREEITSRDGQTQDGVAEEEDMDISEGDNGSDEGATIVDPQTVKMDVLRNIDIASNTAMFTLDAISLLLSKQNPTQAAITLSQHVRNTVGIGTMGTDKLDESKTTSEKTKEQEEIAIGLTLMEINKTRDAAREASNFLSKEMAAEGKFWEDIVSVHSGGWLVSKVPHERGILGVRFGFSEASADFRNNGLAPMRRGEDGSVELDIGRLGGVSERLQVTYEKDGEVVSRSFLPAQTMPNALLEARVLEARNTIFSQELWHELRREARSLAAHDVRTQGSKLTWDLDSSSRITVEFVKLGDKPSIPEDGFPSNNIAETISLALHILLSYAHRHNELTRTRPMPPHIPRSRGQSTYALMRPIILRMMHIRNTRACVQYVSALVKTLKAAGLPASFVLQTPKSTFDASVARGPNQLSPTQALVRNMLQPPEFSISLTFLPETSVIVRGRTFIYPTSTDFQVILPPSSSFLASICPPYSRGYPDVKALSGYLRTATTRILTEHYLAKLSTKSSDFVRSISAASIRDLEDEHFHLLFSMDDDEPGPALTVVSAATTNGKTDTRKWRWVGIGESEANSLDEVVDKVTNFLTTMTKGQKVHIN